MTKTMSAPFGGNSSPQLDNYVDSHYLMLRFHVSSSCLQRLRSQGKIAYLIFAGRAFYLKSDINNFFRSRYGKKVSANSRKRKDA